MCWSTKHRAVAMHNLGLVGFVVCQRMLLLGQPARTPAEGARVHGLLCPTVCCTVLDWSSGSLFQVIGLLDTATAMSASQPFWPLCLRAVVTLLGRAFMAMPCACCQCGRGLVATYVVCCSQHLHMLSIKPGRCLFSQQALGNACQSRGLPGPLGGTDSCV